MVALKVSEIETFLARPNRPIVLIFGPDAGLVRERVEALVRKSVDDPKDPFQLARLDGDDLSSEPTRLLEEANTVRRSPRGLDKSRRAQLCSRG